MKDYQVITSPEEIPLVLKVEEVARILHVCNNCAYRLVGSGELPSLWIGHSCRVQKHHLLAFIGDTDAECP